METVNAKANIINTLNKKRKKITLSRAVLLAILTVVAVGQIFPLIWLVDFSLCKSGDLFGSNILKLPSPPQWHNYITAWVDGKILRFLINSLVVNIASVTLTVLFALMMGYAFTRMEWKFKNKLLAFVLLGLMIPIHATLLPNFISFKALGIQDSYLALIIPYVAFSLPQAVFLMTGFMESIPKSLEESAVLDGCNIFKMIFYIIFPLTKPAIVTVVIMTFLNTWNEFIMAATYLSSNTYRTLPFAVYNFSGQYASNYSVQFSVMALVALPSLIIYIILNEQITNGITVGALKG
jgi:raffinose/stachyose/melibiose transport system permease protein